MRTIWIASALLLCATCLAELAEAEKKYQSQSTVVVFSPRELNTPEYLLQLQLLDSSANQALKDPRAADKALQDLRGGWTVKTESQSFSINTGWLMDEFEKLQKNPTA